MRRWWGWIAIGAILATIAVALAVDGSPSPRLSLDARARAVALQLRCPVCQGESVADSPASQAAAMRAIIRQQLTRGATPAAVKAYFVSKYGTWILLAPPRTGIGALAWLAPPLLLLAGVLLLVLLVVDWRRKGWSAPAQSPREYLARLRAEVAADPLEE